LDRIEDSLYLHAVHVKFALPSIHIFDSIVHVRQTKNHAVKRVGSVYNHKEGFKGLFDRMVNHELGWNTQQTPSPPV
jgi:hypothetical protein